MWYKQNPLASTETTPKLDSKYKKDSVFVKILRVFLFLFAVFMMLSGGCLSFFSAIGGNLYSLASMIIIGIGIILLFLALKLNARLIKYLSLIILLLIIINHYYPYFSDK